MSEGKTQVTPEDSVSRKHQSSITSSIDSHPLTEELTNWFKENGGWLNPDVRILFSDSRGFHLRATRSLSSQDVAICPLRLTLSFLNVDPTQSAVLHVSSPLQKCMGRIPNHVLTYLLLMEQRHLASKGESQWQSYMACLPGPDSLTTPLWFDDEDMESLEGTNLAKMTVVRKNELLKEWEQAEGILRQVQKNIPEDFDL